MSSPYYRPSSYEEQQLYDHLIACRKVETPEALLERFHYLFVDGTNYSEPHILETLHKIADSRAADEEFKFVINRCCRILINFWWFQPSYRWAILDLVDLLQVSPQRMVAPGATRRLQRLVRDFTTTEEYQALQRLAQVIEQGEELDEVEAFKVRRSQRASSRDWASEQTYRQTQERQPRSLRTLIHRYPYLYPHCLSSNSSDSEFDAIRHLQGERQQKFECDLSRYVTYMVQQSDSNAHPRAIPIKNPTLLSDTQLRKTIKHFTGQVERKGTYKDLAQRFLIYTSQVDSYRTFKEGLYHYLVSSIDTTKPDYGKHHFNQWLYTQLKNTLPQSDTQQLNPFLVTRTCHQLIESLVASPQNASNHFVFVDLINNVGATVTTGLLLKLLLLYNNLKSSLEKRLAVLYKHYEPVMDGVEWLIASLENLQIAFSIHFGSMNLPCLTRL
ncbi:hypothetical protein OsccyDRAFT_3456 [Leptolyngbyaceae cyanobacterium JSC-12]|nr:hypothetical protein OsccyDRAFT_3456 [Leptolyngbyaceae cyanobacterium JSC-12]